MEDSREKLKLVVRQFNLYIKLRNSLKNNLIALLDQTFPGVNALFDSPARKDGSQKWVDFAVTFWHCECGCGYSQKAFTERYRKWCKRRGYNFTPAKAADIYATSLGHITTLAKDEETKLLITAAAIQLNAISQAVESLRQQMHRLARSLPEYPVVISLYGVGDTIAAQLMAEIGDVRRFAHKGSLTALAGVDPGSRQSGDYAKRKKSAKHSRKSLF